MVAVEVLALSRRMLLRYVRYPNLLAIVVVQPLLIVFLFRYVFGGAIAVPGLPYVEFLFPGIFALVVVQGSGNTGIGLAEDVYSGVLERYRSLPVSRASMLLARTVADVLKNAITLVLLGALAWVLGFRFATGLGGALEAFFLALGFGVAMAWVSFAVALALGTVEAVQGGLLVLTLALTFMSDAFVPVSTMPGWLQLPVRASPVSEFVGAVRSLTIGVGSSSTGTTLVWVGVFLVASAPVAILRYRHS